MPRGRKKAEKSAAALLQRGLAFCSVAYKVTGDPYQTHVLLHNEWITAFNGVVAAGFPCGECPQAAPHGAKLGLAIDRPGQLNIALGDGVLAVAAGDFRARIPCLPVGTVAPIRPDPPMIPTGDGLRLAMGEVAHLAANSGSTVLESSLLVGPQTISATNRVVVMQVWHGLNLPQDWVIPREFATAVIKAGEPMVGIGYSENTFTVYFESGAWMRTQLYQEKWPDIERVFTASPQPTALPEDFFFGCESLLPFADDAGRLRVNETGLQAESADYACSGLPVMTMPTVLSGKLLALVAGRVNQADWFSSDRAVFFYSATVRAAVMRLQD